MITKFLCALPVLALVAALAVGPSSARAADAALSDAQKAEVEQIIKDYLQKKPEELVQSLQAYQEKQQQDSMNATKESISKNLEKLTAQDLPDAGNKKGDVTVVEFFDYNCGYCKKAIHDIKVVLESDKNVRFVFFDMPILGPTSLTASKWAQAAHKQGKYFEFHSALMEHNGSIDDNVLESTAKTLGLDIEKLKKDAESSEVAKTLEDGLTLGHGIGIQGTPGFVIGGKLFPGYLGEEGLKNAIKEARGGKEG